MFKWLYLNGDVSGNTPIRSRAQEMAFIKDKGKYQMYPLRALHFLEKWSHFYKLMAKFSRFHFFFGVTSWTKPTKQNDTAAFISLLSVSYFYQLLNNYFKTWFLSDLSQTDAEWPGPGCFTTQIVLSPSPEQSPASHSHGPLDQPQDTDGSSLASVQ